MFVEHANKNPYNTFGRCAYMRTTIGVKIELQNGKKKKQFKKIKK